MTKAIETITFDTPIDQAGTKIKEVKLRKPKAGELRGMKLRDVLSMDVTSMIQLLPRITEPALAPATVDEMELNDFTTLSVVVTSFFAKKSQLETAGDLTVAED